MTRETRERSRQLRQPWLRSERAVPRFVVRPLERFLHREAGSASFLMAMALVALIWANVWPDSYEDLWTTVLTVDLGVITISEDARHWVNDLLMAIFFYVVSLEIKRELLFGSLRSARTAAVPIAAAFGTMVGAAFTYLAVNLIMDGDPRGWAIPIATDIAFAVGALGLVGRRAPRELRAFMLTLAVVDDLATIAVIGVGFSQDISLAWLLVAAALAGLVLIAQRIGIRSLVVYVFLAGALWLAVFEGGVHATIAGVVLGFLTPAVAFHTRRSTREALEDKLGDISGPDRELRERALLETATLARESVSPLARMEEQLHPWSAFLVLPLFALANAGVPVSIDGIARGADQPDRTRNRARPRRRSAPRRDHPRLDARPKRRRADPRRARLGRDLRRRAPEGHRLHRCDLHLDARLRRGCPPERGQARDPARIRGSCVARDRRAPREARDGGEQRALNLLP